MEEDTKEVAEEVRRIIPPVDIYETDNDVFLVADVPGVTKENLQLDIDKDELTIRGTFNEKSQDGEKLIDECVYGEYRRTFTLGDTVDREKIAARLENGVLKLTLPRIERVKPRKIEIGIE
jgi:HSP20 family molecular chaperone IbpA